jgi:hypothetical protein
VTDFDFSCEAIDRNPISGDERSLVFRSLCRARSDANEASSLSMLTSVISPPQLARQSVVDGPQQVAVAARRIDHLAAALCGCRRGPPSTRRPASLRPPGRTLSSGAALIRASRLIAVASISWTVQAQGGE